MDRFVVYLVAAETLEVVLKVHARHVRVALLAVACALSSCRCAPEVADLVSVSGGVEVREEGQQEWRKAVAGTPVHARSSLRTLEAGAAELLCRDGSRLSLPAATTIELAEPTEDTDCALRLVTGSLGIQGVATQTIRVASVEEPPLLVKGQSAYDADIKLDSEQNHRVYVRARTALVLESDETTLELRRTEVAVLKDGRLMRYLPDDLFQAFQPEPNAEELTRAWSGVVLGNLVGKVRVRRAGTDEWIDAVPGMEIGPNDEIETGEGASATLRYADGVELDITPGTLVLVREQRMDESGERRVASLEVGRGRVVTRMGSSSKDVTLRILSPTGLVRISSSMGPTRFVMRVGKDKSSEVELKIGQVRIVTSGSSTLLNAGDRVQVTSDGKLSHLSRMQRRKLQAVTVEPKPKPKPEAEPQPELSAPQLKGDHVRQLTAGTDNVLLEWEPQATAARYELQMARDEGFARLLLRQRQREASFNYENQREPTVYWRVRAIDERGHKSPFSRVSRLEFVRGGDRPTGAFFGGAGSSANGVTVGYSGLHLKVFSPANNAVIRSRQVGVRGSVAPGSSVRVNNNPVEVQDDGEYAVTIPLEKGVNQVVVEARDSQGRLAHNTRSVFRK